MTIEWKAALMTILKEGHSIKIREQGAGKIVADLDKFCVRTHTEPSYFASIPNILRCQTTSSDPRMGPKFRHWKQTGLSSAHQKNQQNAI